MLKEIVTELKLESLSSPNILDAMPDGVYLTDRHRKIIFWNRAAERITGWSRADVLGRHCSDNLLVHADKDGHQLCCEETCPLFRAMITGEPSDCPVLVFAQSKSGARIPVEVSVAPLQDHKGAVIGGIEIFRDMTLPMIDLSRARLIQKAALESQPIQDSRLKIATRSTPHGVVGGDFLHVEKIGDNQYAVFVADVCGHGVSAALYTMQLRSFWDEYRHQLISPERFMASVNIRLNELATKNDHFATGVHLLVNADSGEIAYVCAGHESPLHIKTSGNVLRLDQKNPGLGLFPDTVYHQSSSHLAPGESLLLFTDGATEVDDSSGRELGINGLCTFIQRQNFDDPELALNQIESELLKYSHQIRLPDDMSLLCIHRTQNALLS